ncbi:MAG TPA: hypothetical protein VH183_05445 [Burkholderiaceae bacterium]|nr:hypothetical protein [Burkholderiaceae bacterium]
MTVPDPVIGRTALLVVLCATVASCDPSNDRAGVTRGITFTRSEVPVPPQRARVAVSHVAPSRRYFMQSMPGSSYLMYNKEAGKQARRITEDMKGESFFGFTDVTTDAGVVTYARRIEYGKTLLNYGRVLSSGLYALQEEQVRKVLSMSEPGIQQPDSLPLLQGVFIDGRGNLFALDQNRVLCAVRDGRLIATAAATGSAVSGYLNASREYVNGALVPLMFEDHGDDFLVFVNSVPKQPGSFSYSEEAAAKFKVDLQ